MYLIWRMDTTAKGAKKNTSPNVIHLQYVSSKYFLRLNIINKKHIDASIRERPQSLLFSSEEICKHVLCNKHI